MNRLHPSDISIGQNEYTVYELYTMMKEGRIDLEKRNTRWNRAQRSMSIESIFLGLTMTPIYIDASNPKKWIILDGENRLRTIRDFIDNKFELTNLEFFTEFNGCRLSLLPNMLYRKLHEALFTVYSISPSVPPQARLSLIRRIVPDKKSHTKRAFLESLFTPSGRQLFDDMIDYPILNIIFKEDNKTDRFKLIIQSLGKIFKHSNSDFDISDFNLNRIENVIFFLNVQSKVDAAGLKTYWYRSINRIEQLFGPYAFRTSKHANTTNTETFVPLIIYFGNLSGWNNTIITNNRYAFIEQWFQLFKEDDGRKYFRKASPLSAIDKIQNIVDSL